MNKRKRLPQNKGDNNPCPVCGSNNARGIWNDKTGKFTMECLDCGLKTTVGREIVGLAYRARDLEKDIEILNGKIELWTTAFVIVGVIVGWRSSDKYLLLLIALIFGVAWAIDCLRKKRKILQNW